MLAGCSYNDLEATADAAAPATSPGGITLAVSGEPWDGQTVALTRSGETLAALQQTSNPVGANDGFGLFSTTLGLTNKQVTWNSTALKWEMGNTLIWPQEPNNDFYAYAPYDGSYDGSTTSSSNNISFTCPTTNTKDLLWAGVSHTGYTVNLDFHHALAKLSFGTIANNSTHEMLVSDIKVTGDLYASGTLSLADGSWSDLPSPASQTIEIVPNTEFIYIPPQGENPVSSIVSPMLIPGPTVTASYKVYDDPTDFDELVTGMFHSWNWGDPENVSNATQNSTLDGNYISRIGTTVEAGQEVCGTSTVSYLTYADISDYDKLVIVGTTGLGLRVLMNRKKVGDGGGDSNGGGLEEITSTINADGYTVINLSTISSTYGYLHLNAIKAAWGSPSGTVTKVLLVKTVHPRTVSGTTTLEQGKDKTFRLTVGLNHEVVIED